ncbi:MAG TPA: hypothetical protein VHC22_33615 [Pirellulales bacterium]|nr:hypothetical protein [Pirellulales bacterium]
MPRPQFTLRALLVLMLVVAAFLGGMHLERGRQAAKHAIDMEALRKELDLRRRQFPAPKQPAPNPPRILPLSSADQA